MKSFLCAAVAAAVFALAAEPIKIGWAGRDITPDFQVNIPGQSYRRPSEGVLDPLTVTALVLDDGKTPVVFLSGDLLGLSSTMVVPLLERLHREQPDIPIDNVILNGTHSHTSIPRKGPDDRAGKLFQDRAFEAIREAWAKRTPGAIARGSGVAQVGFPRRIVYFEPPVPPAGNPPRGPLYGGRGVMYGSTSKPEFSHIENYTDDRVNFLFTFDDKGALTGAIVNIPCPSQCSEGMYKISADYWHNVREALRAKYGPIFILPQCGAAGDTSPHDRLHMAARRRRWELKYGRAETFQNEFERLEIAEQVLAAFEQTLAWAKKDLRSEMPIRHKVITLELPPRTLTPEELRETKEFLAATRDSQPDPSWSAEKQKKYRDSLAATRKRYEELLCKAEKAGGMEKVPTEIHVVAVGGAAFVSCNFELATDFMHRIQGRSPFDQTLVIQIASGRVGGGLSYLATERAEKHRGYGAIPFSNRVSYRGGQMIVEAALAALREFKK